MDIYHYHPETGEYLGADKATRSPLEKDVFHIPAFATQDQPPATSQGEVAVYRDGAWEAVEDHRGTEYWMGGDRQTISALGQTVPDGASMTEPEPTLDEMRAVAALDRKSFCQKLWRMGVLPKTEAIKAARGEWPDTFSTFTASISEDDATDLQIEWAAASIIHYSADTLKGLALAASDGDQVRATALLDQIFGVNQQ